MSRAIQHSDIENLYCYAKILTMSRIELIPPSFLIKEPRGSNPNDNKDNGEKVKIPVGKNIPTEYDWDEFHNDEAQGQPSETD